jgi:hypothetical protein
VRYVRRARDDHAHAASSEPRAKGATHCPGRDDADDLHARTDITPEKGEVGIVDAASNHAWA